MDSGNEPIETQAKPVSVKRLASNPKDIAQLHLDRANGKKAIAKWWVI